jgi:uncharacterized protein YjdB
MKKAKLLKTLLVPTLGISALGAVTVVATSCSPGTIKVTQVTIDKKSLSLAVGDTATLTATVYPEDATDKTVT